MKQFLALALLLISSVVHADWHKAMLRIREDRGRTISVTVDGVRQNKLGRTLTVNNLAPGRHSIKIFTYNSNGYGYRSGILLYQGDITVKPGRIYYCTAYERALDIEENCCIDDFGNWNHNNNWEDWDNYNNRWNNNTQWYREDEDRRTPTDWNRNYYESHNNNYEDDYWATYNGAISNSRYLLIVDEVRKASFESSKVNLLNTLLRNSRINTNQLIGFLKELTFESTRLQFAKDNYYKLVDKANFFLVNEVFTFQSSKDDLLKFIDLQGSRR